MRYSDWWRLLESDKIFEALFSIQNIFHGGYDFQVVIKLLNR